MNDQIKLWRRRFDKLGRVVWLFLTTNRFNDDKENGQKHQYLSPNSVFGLLRSNWTRGLDTMALYMGEDASIPSSHSSTEGRLGQVSNHSH